MRKISKNSLLIGSALVVLALSACTPTMHTRGNILEDHQIAQVKAGESTRSDVLKSLGSPTTVAPFNDNIWYYIGQETEKRGILDPKVIKERVVVATFDDEGTLVKLEDVDNKRLDIPLARAKTPTHGNDISAVQQILGNLGKFNPQDVEDR